MKAVKLIGQRKLEEVEIESPKPDGNNVIVKVSLCGICGSDLHYWESGSGMGGAKDLVMGHEFCGVVADSGGRKDLIIGDRVTALPLDPCGYCEMCRGGFPYLCQNSFRRQIPGNNGPGAFAEYIKLRPDMVRTIPDSVDNAEAILIEPSAVALHAVRQAGLKAGDQVLIIGAGAIGLLSALWAKISGASYVAVSEINAKRRFAVAETVNIDAVFDAGDPEIVQKIKMETMGGYDVIIETSASEAGINTALKALKWRGRLVLAGISMKPLKTAVLFYVLKEIEQKAAMGYSPAEFDMASSFISDQKLTVKNIVTRTVGFKELQGVFEQLSSGTSSDIKVAVQRKSFL
jgi:2-desacetyl-2-hydroxyethyl bacteriochlorophyllide A dehydrogenase